MIDFLRYPGAKLTAEQVLAIRREYAEGQRARAVTQQQLADKYGVSVITIRNITLRKCWRWLPPEDAK